MSEMSSRIAPVLPSFEMNPALNTSLSEPSPDQESLTLGVDGFSFGDLHQATRLEDLHGEFLKFLAQEDGKLSAEWLALSAGGELDRPAESRLMIAVARHVSVFLARLFGLSAARSDLIEHLLLRKRVYELGGAFTKKRVRKAKTEGVDSSATRRAAQDWVDSLPGVKGLDQNGEERLAGCVITLLKRDGAETVSAGKTETVDEVLSLLGLDVRLRLDSEDAEVALWLFPKQLEKVDFAAGLVDVIRPDSEINESLMGPESERRLRDGFHLTDERASQTEVLKEVDQCLFCHDREKDSCHHGLFKKKSEEIEKNALGIELGGCPLEERISEMHELYGEGDAIAALAMVMIDNPMCPGTGHRICNDCMKSCIFQKQEPVNIPQIETRVLVDTLDLPYGTELYLLLTRFNPLNIARPYTLPYNGKDVLVAGMGPAGYTLAHYLAQEGFGVVGMDGLKVEPLPMEQTGVVGAGGGSGDGESLPNPIFNYRDTTDDLESRILLGFGGVSEYGITVRWDKNFLSLPYLSLERREQFQLHGGTRFGGTVTIESAWDLGFDHIAIATGAGKPTVVRMKNNLARGIRKASDFLMALQLTGAFKKDALANLQLRLPAIVIGGGLTGVDTTTEAIAYYPVQVEKVALRYEQLCEDFGADVVRGFFSDEERGVLDEFVEHGKVILAERARALTAGDQPNFCQFVEQWGGVKLAYRKGLEDSPAYRLNHEEIIKAFEEGMIFVEHMSPMEAKTDKYGAVCSMVFERQHLNKEGTWRGTGETVEMPARSVLVAAGTSPNIMYEKEHPGTFKLDEWDWFFEVQRNDEGARVPVKGGQDGGGVGFFTSYENESRSISVYGDNHPTYAGNVVKAMASARDGFPKVVETFAEELAHLDTSPQALEARKADWRKLAHKLSFELDAKVHIVNRLTPTISEVVVHAPAAARNFEPGQFYRLQNYETEARVVDGTRLALEGIALTGAWKDDSKGLIGLIVLEMGVSSRLCALLQPGEPVILMGPTGSPTVIPKNEKIILLGGGLGNAVLFSIGKAMRDAGNEVIYFAAFKRGEDIFKREEIERAADVVIWSTDGGAEIEASRKRPFDRHFRGNIVQAMLAYAQGDLGEVQVPLDECGHLVCIGSDRMMNAVREQRFESLKPHLKAGHTAIGSINSPMQCAMKEICAQCLCKQVDPETGEEASPVFSCFNQDQELDRVDFENLNQRLRANSVQEKLSNLWLDHLVKKEESLDLWTVL
ncbi:MAG: NADPH-dependent glutamate synthase beta subunit-like oxidoreductase/NAD(P)H-flavin reductase [Candidatus Paceibacteria bacterium]|jgi:NADPH-dependent glutamate synthase beta subunit-like oxidoreductase/NAD(P)H-flavin reductase